jgi:hypothetical protein
MRALKGRDKLTFTCVRFMFGLDPHFQELRFSVAILLTSTLFPAIHQSQSYVVVDRW